MFNKRYDTQLVEGIIFLKLPHEMANSKKHKPRTV